VLIIYVGCSSDDNTPFMSALEASTMHVVLLGLIVPANRTLLRGGEEITKITASQLNGPGERSRLKKVAVYLTVRGFLTSSYNYFKFVFLRK